MFRIFDLFISHVQLQAAYYQRLDIDFRKTNRLSKTLQVQCRFNGNGRPCIEIDTVNFRVHMLGGFCLLPPKTLNRETYRNLLREPYQPQSVFAASFMTASLGCHPQEHQTNRTPCLLLAEYRAFEAKAQRCKSNATSGVTAPPSQGFC
jgi:hypothetical protein